MPERSTEAIPVQGPSGPAAAGIAHVAPEVLERFERIKRYRVLLSFMLLPPLVFFIFIVVWFREGMILIPVAAGIYLYMLAEFFIFQDPARGARRERPSR
jgi:hypothetical protein